MSNNDETSTEELSSDNQSEEEEERIDRARYPEKYKQQAVMRQYIEPFWKEASVMIIIMKKLGYYDAINDIFEVVSKDFIEQYANYKTSNTLDKNDKNQIRNMIVALKHLKTNMERSDTDDYYIDVLCRISPKNYKNQESMIKECMKEKLIDKKYSRSFNEQEFIEQKMKLILNLRGIYDTIPKLEKIQDVLSMYYYNNNINKPNLEVPARVPHKNKDNVWSIKKNVGIRKYFPINDPKRLTDLFLSKEKGGFDLNPYEQYMICKWVPNAARICALLHKPDQMTEQTKNDMKSILEDSFSLTHDSLSVDEDIPKIKSSKMKTAQEITTPEKKSLLTRLFGKKR